MTGIVLASHGGLAEGVRDSLKMLLGEQEEFACVSLAPSMSPDELRAALVAATEGFSDPADVLVLVDLWGGTPFNQLGAARRPRGLGGRDGPQPADGHRGVLVA